MAGNDQLSRYIVLFLMICFFIYLRLQKSFRLKKNILSTGQESNPLFWCQLLFLAIMVTLVERFTRDEKPINWLVWTSSIPPLIFFIFTASTWKRIPQENKKSVIAMIITSIILTALDAVLYFWFR